VKSLVSLRGRVFIALLVSTSACIIGFWVAIPPTYLTNDDVTIRRAIEGLTAPGAAPTGYVLMAHSLLGWAVAWSERLTAVHGWDVVVAGVLMCSIATALTIAWSVFDSVAARALSIIAALVISAPLLSGMQFTISATLAGTAAMAAIAMELLLPEPRKSLLLASAALLFLGLLVRPMSATAGGLLSLALLTPVALSAAQQRVAVMRRLGMAAVALGVLAGALVYLDDALYRLSPAWDAYHRDNWMLAWFFEWGGDLPASQVEPLRAQLGWSPNDWELLRHFWGVDATIHSHERIETLYRSWSAMVEWRDRAGWLLERTAAELTGPTFLRLFADSRLALGVCALVTLAFASLRGVIATLGSIAIFYAASLTMEIVFKELPERLFGPLQVGLVLSVLMTCRVLSRPTTTALLTTLCAAAAAGLLVHEVRTVASQAIADSRQSKETDAQVLDVLQQRPTLLLFHADSFPSEHWWRPFHTPPVALNAIQLGMNNHNPYVQRFVAHSYREPLLHAICTNPSMLVVADAGRLEPVTVFMRERYGVDVDWSEVYQGSFHVWRCSTRKAR
jgi:hypothetical protein